MKLKFAFLYLAIGLIKVTTQSKMSFDQDTGSLYNILIFINDDVPEGDGGLIKDIQRYISDASKQLWTATNNLDSKKSGVKFGSVYIRVPQSWKIKPSAIQTWQQCNNANIFITLNNDNNNGAEYFTIQNGGCGEPGEFTKYSQGFFKSRHVNKGRIIMNEFVKLRYGVFSEKPYRNVLTVFDGQKFVQSSCGADIKWELSKPAAFCSIVDNDCKYWIRKSQNHLYSSMFDEESPSSKFFCDNHENVHNKLSNSLQNERCDKRSISEVILTHSDFDNNSQKKSFQDSTYFIIKGEYRKIVLVIDTSGSMSGSMDNVKNAANEFISNFVEDTAQVGLVSFDYFGKEISKLLSMNNLRNKENLKRYINGLLADGSTNVADGFRKAVKVLGGDINEMDGLTGTFIVLSDGENNEEELEYQRILNILSLKNIVIHTIAYGSKSDQRLIKLTMATGGKFVYADDSLTYPELVNKFSMKMSCEWPIQSPVKITVKTVLVDLKETDTKINLIYVDPYVGKDMILTVTLPNNMPNYFISLIDPKNRQYNATKITKQTNGITLTYRLSVIEVGEYLLNIQKPSVLRSKRSSSTLNITTALFATPIPSSRTIIPVGKLSTLKILQVNSTSSVKITGDLSTCSISMDETVSANINITNPNNKKTHLTLYDNGLGGDAVAGDHIFTAMIFATDLNFAGYFTFVADIKITNDKLKSIISRTVDFDALYVEKVSSESLTDKIPPARIENFRLSINDTINKILTLQFLATGNDELNGDISLYEIKVIGNKSTIFRENVEAPSLQPVSITLNLRNETSDKPFIIMIRGVDPSNNAGKWSPEQIFSWDYQKIWDLYSKFAGLLKLNICNISFGLVLLFITVKTLF